MIQDGRKARTPNEWKFGGTGSILEDCHLNRNKKEKSVSQIHVDSSHIFVIFFFWRSALNVPGLR